MVPNFFSYDMTLQFSEAVFGSEKEFELSHLETCEVCSGTGAKVGSKMRICSTCGGRGQVMRTEQTPFGMFSQVLGNILYIPNDERNYFLLDLVVGLNHMHPIPKSVENLLCIFLSESCYCYSVIILVSIFF